MTEHLEPGERLLPVEASPRGDVVPAREAGFGAGRMDAEDEPSLDLKRYLGALARYKWMILAATIVAGGVGLLVGRWIKPEYETQATIWIQQSPDQKGPEIGPIQQQQLLRAYSWVELLKSDLVIEQAVEDLRLYLTPAKASDSLLFRTLNLGPHPIPGTYRLEVSQAGDSVTLSTRKGTVVERMAVGDSLGRRMGLLWRPPVTELVPGREVKFDIDSPRDAAAQLAKKLRAATDPNAGSFLRLQLDGPDPHVIAATVNAITSRYVDVAAQLKRERLDELARILGQQLQQAEANLRHAENALESFRVETITLPSDRATPVSPGLQLTRDPVFSNFFGMQVELEQIRRDRDAVQRALDHPPSEPLSIEALQAVGAVQKSELMLALNELTQKRATLRALRYQYSDDYPGVDKLAGEIKTLEGTTIPKLADRVLADLASRDSVLEQRIRDASHELRQIPPRSIQEARLERDVTISNNLFTMLQQRYSEARLADVSSFPDVQILDDAVVPDRPVKNPAQQVLLLFLVGGLAIGVVGAILLDHTDPRVRYPDQVTSGMGLPILGAVPHLNGNKDPEELMPVVEAFRGIGLNLMYAHGTDGPLVVTVTSPGPGDGKSFVAANLALGFADSGYATVLIDGDTRRGDLYRLMATPRTPGLTDALAGQVPAESVVQVTEFSGLHFVPGGTRMSRSPELLGSPAVTRFLASLREKYSVIIVDSPPLGAGVDAYALGAATGNLVMVLRTGATDRTVAEAKLQIVDRLPVRVLGAVLNGVNGQGRYSYYSYHIPGYDYDVRPDDQRDGPRQLAERAK
jgi:capsular exopolysaccharide synthesis family protein